MEGPHRTEYFIWVFFSFSYFTVQSYLHRGTFFYELFIQHTPYKTSNVSNLWEPWGFPNQYLEKISVVALYRFTLSALFQFLACVNKEASLLFWECTAWIYIFFTIAAELF